MTLCSLFGSQWTMVANMLIWLAPVAIMQSMVSTTGVGLHVSSEDGSPFKDFLV